MEKAGLRKAILAELGEIGRNRVQISRQLMKAITQHPAYAQSRVLATYLSLPHEIDTTFIIAQALADGKRVLVPKVVGKGQMIFVDYDEADLVTGTYGILEPGSTVAVEKSDIDLIHVPAVGFRLDGYRIGYGGGFYDRYLADYQGQTLGTALDCQLCYFPTETFDVPVKELIIYDTNQGIIQKATDYHRAVAGQSVGIFAHESGFSLSGD